MKTGIGRAFLKDLILSKCGINYAVDKVTMPVNLFDRLNVELKFLKGDTHLETRRNRKYIAKGEI